MTGKCPARLQLTNFLPGRADAPSQRLLQPTIEGQLPLEETRLAERLRAAGYRTGLFGKWHLGGSGFGPVRAVDEAGLADSTIIVVTSDNGGLHTPEPAGVSATHNTPFRAGKGFLYEGGLRVPLIVRWPGVIRPGRTADTPVVLTDLVPTLLEAAGINVAATVGPLGGTSLAGLLQ